MSFGLKYCQSVIRKNVFGKPKYFFNLILVSSLSIFWEYAYFLLLTAAGSSDLFNLRRDGCKFFRRNGPKVTLKLTFNRLKLDQNFLMVHKDSEFPYILKFVKGVDGLTQDTHKATD